jgi:[ribosomal protein S18]-alanine N-acetyltransferase
MPVEPTVAIARPSDASAIAVMSRDLIEHEIEWRWRQERVTKAIDDPETNVAVVRRDSELLGFGIMEYSGDEAHLVLFAVAKSNQRQGVGSALLRWLEAAARASGAQRIRVEARRENVAARCFYNGHGYHEQVLESRMYSKAVDGVRLEKWLRAPKGSDA